VTIASSDGFNIVGSPATVTITNDDSRTLSINDTTVTEGDTGTKTATLRISLSEAAGIPITVDYLTKDGTATTADSDYVAKSGNVIIPAGQTYQDVTFTVNGDYKPEPNEYFDVTISTTAGVTVSDNSGRVTINDDDNRTLTVGGTLTFNEGDVNKDINLTVNLDVASPVDRTIYYYTTAGSATVWNGTTGDFIAVPSTAVTIPANTTSVNLPVTIIGDLVNEPNESFTVTVTSSDGFKIVNSPATVTIVNDDGTLSIVPSVELYEGNTSQLTPFPFAVTLSQASTSTIYVNYTTKDGTATIVDNDYQNASGQLVFAPGDLTKTINVVVVGDIKYEGQEYFDLNISNGQGVTITNDISRGYIDDDDGRVISIDSLSVPEGDSGSKDQNMTVSLTAVAGTDAVIDYTITSTTAIAGVDFVAASGTVTIPAGSLSVEIPVTYYGDLMYEPNQNIKVTISTSSPGFVIPNNVGTLTLVNDDGTVSVADVSVIEGNTGQKSVNVNVSLTDPFDVDTIYNYTLQDGTAKLSNNDYVSATGSVVIPAGGTSASIPLLIQSDTQSEPDEVFYVKITNDQNVTITKDTAAVTILNDDSDAVGLVDEYQRDFATRFRKNLYGDFRSTGAPIMCVVDSSGQCNWNYGGNLMDANTSFLNDVPSMGLNNSSSAELNIAMDPGDTIIWAGLYWQGHIHSTNPTDIDTETGGFNNVLFRTPDGHDYNLTASAVSGSDAIGYYKFRTATAGSNLGYRMFYQGFADVTSEVNQSLTSNPSAKTFSVAGIKATPGVDTSVGDPSSGWGGLTYGNFGGWSLIVVYEKGNHSNPDDLRNVTINDGYKFLIAPPGGTKSIDINISGFKTPKSGTIDSKLLFFGGLGEKNIHGDQMEISDKSGAFSVVSDGKNDPNNPFNDTISDKGVDINATRIYNPGIDLDTIDISSNIGQDQNKTTVRLSVSWISDESDPNYNGSTNVTDQTFAGVVGFSTQLYQPQLCYDFTYEQDSISLKNVVGEHDIPTIHGHVRLNDTITAGIYLKNTDSDFDIKGLSLYTDMNASKIHYIAPSTQTSRVNGSTYGPVLSEVSGSCSYSGSSSSRVCHDAPDLRVGVGAGATGYTKDKAGSLGSAEYVYTQFKLKPDGMSGDVNESLGLKLDYYIDLDEDSQIQYLYTLGQDIKLCPAQSVYLPQWGQFNVVDHNASNNLGTYYNLYTQAAKKPFSADVAFYGKDGSGEYTVPPISEVNTTVMVEIIKVNTFHDINASCSNPEANISMPIFVDINATATDNTQLITLQQPDDYNFAEQNAAFRIWWFDTGSSAETDLAENWTATTNNSYRKYSTLNHINGLFTLQHTQCRTVSACGINGETNTTVACFDCLKENYGHPICSRDNFSIRPEALDVRIRDINQSTLSTYPHVPLLNISEMKGYTPTTTPSGRIDLASGYLYRVDINATNNTDLFGTPRYTQDFSVNTPDLYAHLDWNSSATGCVDTNAVPLQFDIVEGVLSDGNTSMDQIGEYQLSMLDKLWTAVDWRDISHHTTAGFLGGTDCVENSSSVPVDTSTTKIGCNISTNHASTTSGVNYVDPLLTYHPYKFSLVNIAFTRGLSNAALDTAAGARNFLYMADINNSSDVNMSLKASGLIAAVNYKNIKVSNYTAGCYSKDINITVNRTNVPNQNGTAYQARIYDDAYDSGAAVIGAAQSNLFMLNDGNFTTARLGDTNTSLHLNYDHNTSVAVNPMRVDFIDYRVGCNKGWECEFAADGNASNQPVGVLPMGFGVTHYYGRAQGVGSRVKTADAATTTAKGNIRINFEIYCNNDGNLSLLPKGANTPRSDDLYWYKNTDHNTTNDGLADDDNTLVQKPGNTGNVVVNNTLQTVNGVSFISTEGVGFQLFGATYTGDKGYPYTTIMRNTPSGWLVYDPQGTHAGLNEFSLEFYKASNWVGQEKAGSSTDSKASENPSRRIMW
jgi:hypothetical protein